MFESHRNPNSRTHILHKQRSTLTFRFVVSIVLARFHFDWTMDVVLRWAIWKLNKWEHASDSPFFLLFVVHSTHTRRQRERERETNGNDHSLIQPYGVTRFTDLHQHAVVYVPLYVLKLTLVHSWHLSLPLTRSLGRVFHFPDADTECGANATPYTHESMCHCD